METRRGNIDKKYTQAAEALADELYPDMNTIPGGESARTQYEQKRTATVEQGSYILRLLDTRGLEDISQIYPVIEK